MVDDIQKQFAILSLTLQIERTKAEMVRRGLIVKGGAK